MAGRRLRLGEAEDDAYMKIAFLNIRRFKVANGNSSALLQDRLWGFMKEFGVEAVGLGDTGLEAPPPGIRPSDTTHSAGRIAARARHVWGRTGMSWAAAEGYKSGRSSLTEGGTVMALSSKWQHMQGRHALHRQAGLGTVCWKADEGCTRA